MIQIENTLVSEEILERKFVCNLNACKGACCVEGDAGAPLTDEELDELENVFEVVKPYLSEQSIAALEEDLYTVDADGDYVTKLVDNRECAFVFYDEENCTKCAIEQAYLDGKTTFKKPISCHLFPVRLSKISDYTAVNYAYWDICDAACELGEKLGVKTYQFLKEPLIRKFGEAWFNELTLVDELLEKERNKK